MKILFIDIDGVLNKLSDKPSRSTPHYCDRNGRLVHSDPELVFRLNKLVDATDCKLVLSSAWRQSREWREDMKAQGIVSELLDRTPLESKDSICRGNDIRDWLEAHPEVDDYAILDDKATFLPEQESHLYRCRTDEGLTEEIYEAIKKRFTKP
jgi:hypothetical protein